MLRILTIVATLFALIWAAAVMPLQISYDMQSDTVSCEQTLGTMARCDEQSVSSLFALLAIVLSAIIGVVVAVQSTVFTLDRLDRLLPKLFDPIQRALRSGTLQPLFYA